ncbi:group III truncated hemoglobin [Mycolicibacter acidiphilus]|uniref:group III truncated hemoglobin n=1 Tax=Mycolicibacter acidiphilus TaxID=2835306 RepID=UPI002022BD48|nr:group III truncated hemoglobin [Mycolicibacter acidiphilus]
MTELDERTTLADLADRDDVEALLWRFYGTVLYDDILGEPFAEVRDVHGLAEHIPVMADFWETVLFKVRRYQGHVQDVHGRVHETTALSTPHFLRWLTTWYASVDDMFAGPLAERAKRQAARICWSMHRALTGGDDAELNELVKQCTELAVRLRDTARQPRSTDAIT